MELFNVPFVFTKLIPITIDRHFFLKKKGRRLFNSNSNITERIEKIGNQDPTIIIETTKQIIEFLNQCDQIFKNDLRFEKFKYWEKIEIKDYVNQQYITPFTRQIYSCDTTRLANGIYLILLVDNGSRKIVTYKITRNWPTRAEIIEMYKEYFTPELAKRCHLIHCDRSGVNLTPEVIKYLEETLKIKVSFTTKLCHNQLVEGTNNIIKKIIKSVNFYDLPADFKFENLTFDKQVQVTKFAIQEFNNQKTTKLSTILQGFSRNDIDKSKEFARKVLPDKIDNSFLLANNKTIKGELYSQWSNIILKVYILYKKQEKFNFDQGMNLNLINEEKIITIHNSCFKQNPKRLYKINKRLTTKEDLIDNLLIQTLNLESQGITGKQITDSLLTNLKDRFDNTSNNNEKKNIKYQMGLLYLSGLNQQENTDKQNQIIDQLKNQKQTIDELKNELKNDLNKQNSIIDANQKALINLLTNRNTNTIEKTKNNKRELNINHRKTIRTLIEKEQQAVMPEDFVNILKIVSNTYRKELTKAKYILLHGFLRITGANISSAKYFNLHQLTNLMEKKTFYVTQIKRGKKKILEFPYVKEIDVILNNLINAYNVIKNLQYSKCSLLFKTNKNSSIEDQNLVSELYGSSKSSYLQRQLNTHLNIAGNSLNPKKKLTAKSYRNGIDILITRLLGTTEAEYFFGSQTMNCTSNFLEKRVKEIRLRRISSTIYSVKNSKDVIP
jgi:hypothetical protein